MDKSIEKYIDSIEKLLLKGQRKITVIEIYKEDIKEYFAKKGWQVSDDSVNLLEFTEPRNFSLLLD